MPSNVGIASLTGGPANATFALSGWSGTTSVAAGSGTNMLVVAAGSVQTTSLTVSNVQNLNVTGGTLDANAIFKSIPTVNVLIAGTLELDNGVTLTANVSNAGILTPRRPHKHREGHTERQLCPAIQRSPGYQTRWHRGRAV